jgi:hypothetical protein
MGVKLSEMTAETSPAGTEKILVLDGSTSKTMTAAVMAAYAIDVLGAAATATPTTGDYIVAYRSMDEKRLTLDTVATYVVASAWSVAATVTPAASGDLLLVQRGSTVYDMDVDTLKTYALVDNQANVLNLSGLGPATLANTDLLAICQTTTAKKATIASLETLLWTDYGTYVAGLTAVDTPADTNKFYVLEGTTAKYVTATVLASYMSDEIIDHGDIQAAVLDTLDTYTAALDAVTAPADTDTLYCLQGATAKKLALLDLANYAVANAFELPWREVSTSKFTTTPYSTSVLTFLGTTSDFKAGLPVKWSVGGLTYYGIVTAVSPGASITIAGASLGVAALSTLYVGSPDMVTQKEFLVDTAYGNTAQDLFSAVTYERHRWDKSAAYLVQFSATHGVIDTGAAQPKLNVRVGAVNGSGGDLVSTEDMNKGLQLSATAGTWTPSSAVAINTSNYRIARGEEIDLRCTVAGTNGDADMLSVTCVFVSE